MKLGKPQKCEQMQQKLSPRTLVELFAVMAACAVDMAVATQRQPNVIAIPCTVGKYVISNIVVGSWKWAKIAGAMACVSLASVSVPLAGVYSKARQERMFAKTKHVLWVVACMANASMENVFVSKVGLGQIARIHNVLIIAMGMDNAHLLHCTRQVSAFATMAGQAVVVSE